MTVWSYSVLLFPSFSLQSNVRGVRHWVRKGGFQWLQRREPGADRLCGCWHCPLTTASTPPTQCFKLPACITHPGLSAANSTATYLHKAQLKREQNAHFQARIELVCPEECWHSAILFQRLTIFNLKSLQRPLKKPLDSIEHDQIGYHNLSVYSKDLCKIDYIEKPQDINLTKVNNTWYMNSFSESFKLIKNKKKLNIHLQYLNILGHILKNMNGYIY